MTNSPAGGPVSMGVVPSTSLLNADGRLPRPYADPDFDPLLNSSAAEQSPDGDSDAQARLEVVRARMNDMMDTPVVSR